MPSAVCVVYWHVTDVLLRSADADNIGVVSRETVLELLEEINRYAEGSESYTEEQQHLSKLYY
jgi:hypothetical protein